MRIYLDEACVERSAGRATKAALRTRGTGVSRGGDELVAGSGTHLAVATNRRTRIGIPDKAGSSSHIRFKVPQRAETA